MKVNKDSSISPILLQLAQNCEKQNADEPIDKVCAKSIEKDAAICLAQMGKAQVFMQNTCAATKNAALQNTFAPQKNEPTQNPCAETKTTCATATQKSLNAQIEQKSQSDEEIKEIVNKILESEGLQLGYFRAHGKFISAGLPIEGFKNLCSDDFRATCIKNEDGTLKEVYFLDKSDGSVRIFDENGELKRNFSAFEMKSLKEYKYSPNSFHNFLRYGRISGLPPQAELESFINCIENIFNDDKKAWKTQKPMKVYRALQSKLSDEQIQALSHIGGEFVDTSFVSTSTRKAFAMIFAHHNPILEIELPENAKYIDLDALFNIDRQHWNEHEFLLNKNSRFVVTGFEPENNIVKVKLIG